MICDNIGVVFNDVGFDISEDITNRAHTHYVMKSSRLH